MANGQSSKAWSTPDQARELLTQIDQVTTRGEPLMNRFFFVEHDIVPPPRFRYLFPKLDHPERYDRMTLGFLFSHRISDSAVGDEEDVATLTFSRNGYQGEKTIADVSMIYRVIEHAGQHRLEQRLSYEVPVKSKGRTFSVGEEEAMAAYLAEQNAEIKAERRTVADERNLGLLAVYYTTAEDLIAFAKSHNPHHTG
jgi:hypothetical protein